MNRKVRSTAAMLACVVLVAVPILAAERSTDRSAERVQRGTNRAPTQNDVVWDHLNERILVAPKPVDNSSVDEEINLYRGWQLFERASDLQANGQEDVSLRLLAQIASLQLGSSSEANALRTKLHISMARFYEDSPPRQVSHLNAALHHAADEDTRKFLRDRIESVGGVVLTDDAYVASGGAASLAVRSNHAPGDDTCETALPAVLASEVQEISYPGDANWRSIVLDEPEELLLISTHRTENTLSGDTSMWLYQGPCPGTLIDFDEDGGEGYMAFIQQVNVPPGTYYVEVRGWCTEWVGAGHCSDPTNEVVVGEYSLDIYPIEDLPTQVPPDNYEPDDVRELANKIGHPTSTPLHANAWGRAKRDIQAHTISSGEDEDWMALELHTPQIVQFGTKHTWPTFFNNFTDIPLEVQGRHDGRRGFSQRIHYGIEPCSNVTDEMCEPCNEPDCLPCCFVDGRSYQSAVSLYEPAPVSLVPDSFWGVPTPAEFSVCLPNTMHANTSWSVVEGEPWYAVVTGGGYPTDVFEYEFKAATVLPCKFEVEPNDSRLTPNELNLGETVHGLYEFSAWIPYADLDWYAFDINEWVSIIFETTAPNMFASDPCLELWVGPIGDPFPQGTFLMIISDDDGGLGWQSRLEISPLLPAAEFLELFGIEATPATSYRLMVGSYWLTPDFPYALMSEVTRLPIPEIEPNDFSEAGSNWMSVDPGQVIDAEVIQTCDLDTYRISLSESTYLKLETATGTLTDTVIEMVDCQNGTVIANICNDDGGAGLASRLEGCLGIGDHCFRVRGFHGSATGTYEFKATAVGTGCPAMNPPSMTSSGPNLGCMSNDCL